MGIGQYLGRSHCHAAAMPHEIRLIAIGRDQNDPDHAARRRCDVLRIRVGFGQRKGKKAGDHAQQTRSEEHTSELQSLMRISYAVFCLKQKNTVTHTTTNALTPTTSK